MTRHAMILAALLPFITVAARAAENDPSGYPVVHWKDAARYLGKVAVVQGRIVAARNIGKICFLNFDDPASRTFTAIVKERNYKRFSTPPEVLYKDKWVRIRGMISEFRGKMQIEVLDPDQVTILEKEEPIPPERHVDRRPFDGTVTVGTFNLLNLFDDHDDPYHADEGTPAKPEKQRKAAAAAIRKLNADVLALQEVENRGVLEEFVRTLLPDMGYEHVVCFESNDHRGIDCAVLSRIPVGPVSSYRHLRFSDGSGAVTRFRRDLIEVRIEPNGYEAFTVFAVHLKSKAGGGKSLALRKAEARQIRVILDGKLRKNPAARFVLCGDMNDTWESDPLKILRGEGVAELTGFVDQLPKGTVTYKGRNGDVIDYLLCSPEMARRYEPKSYRVDSGSLDVCGSDHNPVIIRFLLAPASTSAGGRAG